MANDSALGVGWGVLTQRRLQAITEVLTRQQRIDRSLVFLSRTPINLASESELLGQFEGDIFAADIVMDDQQATVHDIGKFTRYRNEIANLKHGIMLGQQQLNELDQLRGQNDPTGNFLDTWITRRIAQLILGIRLRLEALVVACYLDSTVYDRYGVKINGTWGMPTALKYSTVAPWNDINNSTPVADIQFMVNEVAPDLNSEFTRITMSRKAFAWMVKSKEFQAKAKIIPTMDFQFNFLYPDGALPNSFDPRIARLAEAVTGVSFELYDTQTKEKNSDGGKTTKRILPHNKLILSSPANDNNSNVIDVGNGITTESLVAEIVQTSVVGGLSGRAAGPLSYAAPTSIDLNSPGVSIWSVMRAFPRKWDKNATGQIDIGIDPVTGA